MSQSKEAKRQYAREYYLRNKDRLSSARKHYRMAHSLEIEAKRKQKRRQIKLETLLYYSGTNPPVCARCGIDDIDVLCIDHTNGGGNKHKLYSHIHSGGAEFYYYLKSRGYPAGFQVLCFNCNMKKSFNEDNKG